MAKPAFSGLVTLRDDPKLQSKEIFHSLWYLNSISSYLYKRCKAGLKSRDSCQQYLSLLFHDRAFSGPGSWVILRVQVTRATCYRFGTRNRMLSALEPEASRSSSCWVEGPHRAGAFDTSIHIFRFVDITHRLAVGHAYLLRSGCGTLNNPTSCRRPKSISFWTSY